MSVVFTRIAPAKGLEFFIECYWMVEDPDPAVRRQKIIPDGFTELIFHYGDPFRIQLYEEWRLQSRYLLAGQISKHFFLENTGVSGIIGVKFQPAALTHLYQLDMHLFTDRVVDIPDAIGSGLHTLSGSLHSAAGHDERTALLNEYFLHLPATRTPPSAPIDKAIAAIFQSNGMTTVAAVSRAAGIGERQLENLFSRYIGLSPKYYMRVIRFNYIFHLIGTSNATWTSLAYEAAFFDQSHFIRNFRNFTGENPSDYAFDEKTMANFFLRKR